MVGLRCNTRSTDHRAGLGITQSALFSTVTTAASCGAVNSMIESFLPLGGMVPMVNIMLGEIIFGGVGSGLYGFLLFAIVAVFVARADGRAHAGIPWQKDRGEGGEDDNARHSLPAADDARLHRIRRGDPGGRIAPVSGSQYNAVTVEFNSPLTNTSAAYAAAVIAQWQHERANAKPKTRRAKKVEAPHAAE